MAPAAVKSIVEPAPGSTACDHEPQCSFATSLAQVGSAWRLVYQRYVQLGLIHPNPFGIHAVPAAAGREARVLWGPEGREVGYTMTLFGDSDAGLALDNVYRRSLNVLRRKGRSLLEVGLLADRRRYGPRGIRVLFSMMRWAIYYGLHAGWSDILIGVHPRHARFYLRCYGFEEFASPTSYPLVRNHPVVPLRLRLREQLAQDVLPRGLAHARNHPVSSTALSPHFSFTPEQLRDSLVARFLKARYDVDPSRDVSPSTARIFRPSRCHGKTASRILKPSTLWHRPLSWQAG